MEIVNCYKGVFCFNHINRHGIDIDYVAKFDRATENHVENLYNDAKKHGHNVDTIVSTYEYTQEYKDLITNRLKSSADIGFDSNLMLTSELLDPNKNTWQAQLHHYKKIIVNIKILEEQLGKTYDLIITNRFDLMFNKRLSELNIDKEKFNIVFQHLSGNCDDNFWIFPRHCLDLFENSINDLICQNMITHAINHMIVKNAGDIHYMYEHDNNSKNNLGHSIFDIIR